MSQIRHPKLNPFEDKAIQYSEWKDSPNGIAELFHTTVYEDYSIEVPNGIDGLTNKKVTRKKRSLEQLSELQNVKDVDSGELDPGVPGHVDPPGSNEEQ